MLSIYRTLVTLFFVSQAFSSPALGGKMFCNVCATTCMPDNLKMLRLPPGERCDTSLAAGQTVYVEHGRGLGACTVKSAHEHTEIECSKDADAIQEVKLDAGGSQEPSVEDDEDGDLDFLSDDEEPMTLVPLDWSRALPHEALGH